MTKTWDPGRADRVGHWRRGRRTSKKVRRKYDDVARRDGHVFHARRIARLTRIDADLKRGMVAGLMKRADRVHPLSRRQICGFIELLGRDVVERMGFVVQ